MGDDVEGARAVTEAVLAALRSEPRLGATFRPEQLAFDGEGTLTLAAEVADVAAKTRALEAAARHPAVRYVVDRVRVTPAARMTDDEILAHLRTAFATEPALQGYALCEAPAGPTPGVARFVPVSGAVEGAGGRIDYEVRDGVVILNGAVPGLVAKRLAGAMAWWVPGVRDVVNALEAMPPEEDAPILIEEAVRVVLERDPWLEAGQIRVGVRGRVVRLTGLVASEAQRHMAEHDAWSVFGVDEVVNEIEVRA